MMRPPFFLLAAITMALALCATTFAQQQTIPKSRIIRETETIRETQTYRGNPEARSAARRTKLAQARHQRKEKNLELQQRTLPLSAGEGVASD